MLQRNIEILSKMVQPKLLFLRNPDFSLKTFLKSNNTLKRMQKKMHVIRNRIYTYTVEILLETVLKPSVKDGILLRLTKRLKCNAPI